MNTFMLIDLIHELTEVLIGLVEVDTLMKCDFLFLEGAHQPFRIAMLRGIAESSHTELGTNVMSSTVRARCW
jgi:hypothetical protein